MNEKDWKTIEKNRHILRCSKRLIGFNTDRTIFCLYDENNNKLLSGDVEMCLEEYFDLQKEDDS